MNLSQIYERHADFVWRTLRRLGVNEAEARDAAHDVFVIVHQNLARFEGRSSLNTWLFTICRSVARDFRRKERRGARLWSEAEVDETIDLRADVSRAFEHQEQLTELERILMHAIERAAQRLHSIRNRKADGRRSGRGAAHSARNRVLAPAAGSQSVPRGSRTLTGTRTLRQRTSARQPERGR